MINFMLKCASGHQFESWFQSSAAFDSLKQAGMVTCAICGSSTVEKALMAPSVRESRERPAPAPAGGAKGQLRGGTPDRAAQLAQIKRHIEANSEYVGLNFAQEARDMHDGLIPGRAIYGEAKPDEARKLIEDGVPVAPLPFMPGRKTN